MAGQAQGPGPLGRSDSRGWSSGSGGRLDRGPAVARPGAGRGQVDAVEDQGRVRPADLGGVAVAGREPEGALLQPLVPEGEAVPIPVEDLDAVAPPIMED